MPTHATDPEVTTALRNLRRAERALEQRRAELAAAIAGALERGCRQVDLVRQTGYTREHIRRIRIDHATR